MQRGARRKYFPVVNMAESPTGESWEKFVKFNGGKCIKMGVSQVQCECQCERGNERVSCILTPLGCHYSCHCPIIVYVIVNAELNKRH